MTDMNAMREALEWYAEQVAGCRKIGSVGEPARHALDRDGGERARNALALLATDRAAGVGEGWKLVPSEPTEAMLDMAEEANYARSEAEMFWSAMLAASPPAPADANGEVERLALWVSDAAILRLDVDEDSPALSRLVDDLRVELSAALNPTAGAK